MTRAVQDLDCECSFGMASVCRNRGWLEVEVEVHVQLWVHCQLPHRAGAAQMLNLGFAQDVLEQTEHVHTLLAAQCQARRWHYLLLN
jgi:hypothetical protein